VLAVCNPRPDLPRGPACLGADELIEALLEMDRGRGSVRKTRRAPAGTPLDVRGNHVTEGWVLAIIVLLGLLVLVDVTDNRLDLARRQTDNIANKSSHLP
jgi:hypothetical protein